MAFLVDQVIPSVRLIRTGLRRDGMFLISSNGLALWFATTGCWCKPDSRFEKESLLALTRRDSQEIPTNIKIIARRGKLLKSESAQITRDRDPESGEAIIEVPS